jgi:hypothetical protein
MTEAERRESRRRIERNRDAKRTGPQRQRAVEKGARSRHKLRAMAITIMGGCCSRPGCGFDDPRALQFDHVKAVRRRLNGGSNSAKSSDQLYRAIIRGERDGLQLLCANCHAIKTREEDNADGTLNLNWSRCETTRQRLLKGMPQPVPSPQLDLL